MHASERLGALAERINREHARRHLEPHEWGRAFTRLCEIRGVKVGQGARNDQTSATVAEVAAELGVDDRTARHRTKLARWYEELSPEGVAAFDAAVARIECEVWLGRWLEQNSRKPQEGRPRKASHDGTLLKDLGNPECLVPVAVAAHCGVVRRILRGSAL